jgi:hypothetical protein
MHLKGLKGTLKKKRFPRNMLLRVVMPNGGIINLPSLFQPFFVRSRQESFSELVSLLGLLLGLSF